MGNVIRHKEKLGKFVKLREKDLDAFKRVTPIYPFSITPYYLSLIDPENPNDPIRKMTFPSIDEVDECIQENGESDPLCEERDMRVPHLTHRYPDRVLLVVTNFCPSLCRFCMRKRNWLKPTFFITDEEIERAANYIESNREIRDVLISGGDPLMLKNGRLSYLLERISSIKHVEVIRIGTRSPVFLPQRLYDEELLRILEKNQKVWLNTHFNHPNEITEESRKAVLNLLKAGVPVNNQSVLLKGINDDEETLKVLFHKLQTIKVRPYYLFHCDPVKGVMHFSTPISKGIDIMNKLLGYTSPFGIPYYAVDGPGGKGKVQIMPDRVTKKGKRYIFKNYKGETFEMLDR